MNIQDNFPLRRGNIRVRDPFIVADADAGLYRMYLQSRNRGSSKFKGVDVCSSPDLKRWSKSRPVLVLSADQGVDMVWAPGCVPHVGKGLVTDGPFMHRTASGALLMLWSTFISAQGYSLLAARSASGSIAGPWIEQYIVAGDDGGHGMLFSSFSGERLLALHRPNSGRRERLRVSAIHEHGDGLSIE